MTGMEHAIEIIRRQIERQADRFESIGASAHVEVEGSLTPFWIAEALAEAGLLAPAPLTEIRAENQFGEMHRRWATDWEPVDRAEGDGRADRPSWVDEHGINHADGDGGRW